MKLAKWHVRYLAALLNGAADEIEAKDDSGAQINEKVILCRFQAAMLFNLADKEDKTKTKKASRD